MHDLNQSIENWKLAVSQGGTCSQDELRELEAHLRDQIADLAESGLSEQEAFSIGVARMGMPSDLGAEYEKVSPMRLWRRRLLTLLWAVPALGVGCFVALVLAPKAQALWQHSAGPNSGMESGPRWILDMAILILKSLMHYGPYLLLAAVAAMILSDARGTGGWRYRHLPFSVIAFSVNFAVLVAITLLCIALAIVAPALAAG